MVDSYKLGAKTAELLARVIVLRDLQKAGKLDLRYGKKGELQEVLECGPMALNRSLAALEELEPEIDRLLTKFNTLNSIPDRVKALLDLSEKRYAEMKQNPILAIPYEDYYQLLQAEGLVT